LFTREHIASLQTKIFREYDPDSFNALALDIFRYQSRENNVYRDYLTNLGKDIESIHNYREIPHLPIGFFKNRKVITGDTAEEIVFSSSGTSGMHPSRHYVKDLSMYRESFTEGFKKVYGDPAEYRILALLPSYLEREGSSLVYMTDQLIKAGAYTESGFFLNDLSSLAETLKDLSQKNLKTLLIGVSFALLDFADQYAFPLGRNTLVMETGGMKGRREEITREELHHKLKQAFGLSSIHTEYGMTELLSQAYASTDGRLIPPPWMKILIRDIQDPFSLVPDGNTGALNIIDLANLHSCAFIETQDLGRVYPDGSFEVLGRTDHSDVRGCSLMVY